MLIYRTFLQQLFCELGTGYDAFLNEELCQCICHGEGLDHEFFERYGFVFVEFCHCYS